MMDLESETFILLNNVKSSYYCFNLFTITESNFKLTTQTVMVDSPLWDLRP